MGCRQFVNFNNVTSGYKGIPEDYPYYLDELFLEKPTKISAFMLVYTTAAVVALRMKPDAGLALPQCLADVRNVVPALGQ